MPGKARYDYTPFGEVIGKATTPRLTFLDKEKDKESSLNDLGARKYDALIGRFTSVDPSWGLYPNLTPYHYSLNNPLILKDDNGKWAWIANTNFINNSIEFNGGGYVKGFIPYKDIPNNTNHALRDKINGFADKWKNTAPAVSQHLINNSIPFGVAKMNPDPRFNAEPVGLYDQNGNIALNVSILPNSLQMEATTFHELVHSMGKNEYQVRCAELAMGFITPREIMGWIKKADPIKKGAAAKREEKINYLFDGAPPDLKLKVLDGNITEDELINEMSNTGKSIIGK